MITQCLQTNLEATKKWRGDGGHVVAQWVLMKASRHAFRRGMVNVCGLRMRGVSTPTGLMGASFISAVSKAPHNHETFN